MPPKTKSRQSARSDLPKKKDNFSLASSDDKHKDEAQAHKRKRTTTSDDPQKAPRRSARGARKSTPTPTQLLNYMLSDAARELCRPEEEVENIKARGEIRTYTSMLNPFEELLCAVILSRPISHRLGLRSIRTVLNPPYEFTGAKAVRNAGKEKQVQSMYDARTQHKDKTANQIGEIAEVVLDRFTSDDDKEGTQMGKLLDECDNDIDKILETLRMEIKGFGKTGMSIFQRRIQGEWPSAYPFVDEKSDQALSSLRLPREAEELRKLLEQHWSDLDTKNIHASDEATKKRRAFTVILERATGAGLEGKVEQILAAAASD